MICLCYWHCDVYLQASEGSPKVNLTVGTEIYVRFNNIIITKI